MPDILSAQVGLNLAASAVGALAAGYLGVRFGLYRLQRERGFDQRLAWYKEMLASLHDAAKLIDELREASPEVRALMRGEAAAAHRIRRFDLALAEARAYATPRSIAALNDTARRFVEISARGDAETDAEVRDEFSESLEAMLRASDALSDEVRVHLGLGKVSESAWPFERLASSHAKPSRMGNREDR